VSGDGRHLGPEKRTPFTRPPRNRSWRPSDSHIDRVAIDEREDGGGDRDARGGLARYACGANHAARGPTGEVVTVKIAS
jgi:hypothetical protein